MATPLFLQPGPNIPFWVLFGAFAVGEVVLVVRSRINRSGKRVGIWNQLATVVGIDGSVAAGLVCGVHGVGAVPWEPVSYIIGLALMAVGLTIRQWAIFSLGQFFTDTLRVRAGQTVIDRGPYRWVRHPSYTGLIVFFAGLGLCLASWLALLVLVLVPTTVLVWRIRVEERALFESAGDEYRQYAQHRKRLFPGMW